jgi:hypothetical protein
MPFSSLQQPTARDICCGIMESSIDWGISLKNLYWSLRKDWLLNQTFIQCQIIISTSLVWLHTVDVHRIYWENHVIAFSNFFHIHPMGIAPVHCSSRHTHTKQQKKSPKVWFFQSMDLDIISLERHSLWDSLVPPAMLFYTIGQASFSKCFAGTDCLGTPRNQLWNGKKSVSDSVGFFFKPGVHPKIAKFNETMLINHYRFLE